MLYLKPDARNLIVHMIEDELQFIDEGMPACKIHGVDTRPIETLTHVLDTKHGRLIARQMAQTEFHLDCRTRQT